MPTLPSKSRESAELEAEAGHGRCQDPSALASLAMKLKNQTGESSPA